MRSPNDTKRAECPPTSLEVKWSIFGTKSIPGEGESPIESFESFVVLQAMDTKACWPGGSRAIEISDLDAHIGLSPYIPSMILVSPRMFVEIDTTKVTL